MKTFYISTPIYYPSGKPHIGHAYSTILADVINRYKKLIGYETFFVTGTDEHGKKIQLKASEQNLTPQQYVDEMVVPFLKLWSLLGIEYDYFSRTTNTKHIEVVQKIFRYYFQKDLIYLNEWSGWYCNSCEENVTLKDAIKLNNQFFCKQNHQLIQVKEESYFFKMSLFNTWIQQYFLNNPDFIYPIHRQNELLNNFLNDNSLSDLSISRSSFDWGVVIENSNHVIYVWMDALFNYLTSLGFWTNDDHLYQKFWNRNDNCERVHILSKEITRFHCIYWPIFLNALDVNLPTKIISHGWILTNDGQKMSKSFGTVVDPFSLLNDYSRDAIRYYLIKEMSLNNDNHFSIEALIGVYNGDLANNFGNLISRSIGMLKKYHNGVIPQYNKNVNNENIDIIFNKLKGLHLQNIELINDFNLTKLLNEIQLIINDCNKLIENTRPWELFKNHQLDQLNNILVLLFKVIEFAIFWLQPVLIDGTISASKQTNLKPTFDSILLIDSNANVTVNQSIPIYERIKNE